MGKRTKVGSFIHSTWTNMNIRCSNGKYSHLQTKEKCKAYENILITFSREEYKDWCWTKKDLIESLNRPSIDRINSSLDYSLDNIQIIELVDNIKDKRPGNKYLNGTESKKKRATRKTSSGRYSTRITFNGKERHLGTFDTKEEAESAFYKEYFLLRGEYPW